MKLSIIIPTYNRASSLEKVISDYISIVKINIYSDFEFLIIDDCSTDETVNVLKDLKNKHECISYFSLDENLGPGIARNFGVNIARGEFVFFLDDDDELCAHGFHLIAEALLDVDGSIDLIAHSLSRNYKSFSRQDKMLLIKNVLSFREKQEVFNFIVKKTIIEDARLFFSSGYHEDVRYTYQLIHHSKNIFFTNKKIYIKNKSEGSITFEMTTQRVDGYIEFLREVTMLLGDACYSCDGVLISEVKEQLIGVILYLICKESRDKGFILICYFSKIVENNWDLCYPGCLHNANETNFKYACSEYFVSMKAQVGFNEIYARIKSIFNSKLSCKDLQSSLFLGPDEVRACCKRFFVNGIQKGDVVLLKADASINFDAIVNAKNKLIDRINSDNAPECSSCPYVERFYNFDSLIDYISLENFSFCNMRCTYCSPKYYGGQESLYNADNIIDELNDRNGIDENCHVVWGGGEPTMSPRFSSINSILLSNDNVFKVRVLTNSLKYSESLASIASDTRVHIVTSLDAGLQSTFISIRGKGDLSKVVDNLVRYSNVIKSSRNITIKYILTNSNFHTDELIGFVKKIMEAGLINSMFQISCDFTLSSVNSKIVCAMYELATRLFVANASIVYFDDLIRDRFFIDDNYLNQLYDHINLLGLTDKYIASSRNLVKFVLWGNGLQANWCMNNTTLGRAHGAIPVVTSEHDLNYLIKENLISDFCIFPSGVQSMFEIINNIEMSIYSYALGKYVMA